MAESKLADRFEDLFLSAIVSEGSGPPLSPEDIRKGEHHSAELAVEVRDAEGYGSWTVCYAFDVDREGGTPGEFLSPGRGINAPGNPDGFDGLPITERLRAEAEDEPVRGAPSWCDPLDYALFTRAREWGMEKLSDHIDAMEEVAAERDPRD